MLSVTLDLKLPWSVTEGDDAKFNKLLRNLLIALVVVALIVPFLPVDEITREQKEALPPQLARVIMEKKKLPPPPKPKPKPKKKVEKKKEEPKEKKPKPKPKPAEEKIEKAKEMAAVSGLLAFQDDLADMRESLDVDSLNDAPMSVGDSKAASVERSVITGKAAQGSGGIAVSKLSKNVGGGALSGRTSTQVKNADKSLTSKAALAKVKASGRSDESIRRVMDRNKAPIFSIYNRALRKDPSIEGQFVFEMIISPSGRITSVRLISSELGDDKLDKKILSRIRLISFGKAKSLETKVNYSFDFVPY